MCLSQLFQTNQTNLFKNLTRSIPHPPLKHHTHAHNHNLTFTYANISSYEDQEPDFHPTGCMSCAHDEDVQEILASQPAPLPGHKVIQYRKVAHIPAVTHVYKKKIHGAAAHRSYRQSICQ